MSSFMIAMGLITWSQSHHWQKAIWFSTVKQSHKFSVAGEWLWERTHLGLLGDAELGKLGLGSSWLWLAGWAPPVGCAMHTSFCRGLQFGRLIRSLILAIHWPYIGGWFLLDQAGFWSQGWRKVLNTVSTTVVLSCHRRCPFLGLKPHLHIAHLLGPWLLSAHTISKQGPERALWYWVGRRRGWGWRIWHTVIGLLLWFFGLVDLCKASTLYPDYLFSVGHQMVGAQPSASPWCLSYSAAQGQLLVWKM
jgi:hypothetical protein